MLPGDPEYAARVPTYSRESEISAKTFTLASGLTDATHTIRVYKVGSPPLPPPALPSPRCRFSKIRVKKVTEDNSEEGEEDGVRLRHA